MKKLILALGFALIPSVALACPGFGQTNIDWRFSSDDVWQPQQIEVPGGAGGGVNLGKCNIPTVSGERAEGWVVEEADFQFDYLGGGLALEFRVVSECDSILLINTANENWFWDDDDNRDSYQDAKIRFTRPSRGRYDVWIGQWGGGNCDAALIIESFN